MNYIHSVWIDYIITVIIMNCKDIVMVINRLFN